MRILLDTHVLIAVLESRLDVLQLGARAAVTHPEAIAHASVASLWEIAIKARLRKLTLGMPLLLIPDFAEHMRIKLIAIGHRHVLTEVAPEPATRDPFDRLLLAQCLIENLRLVTMDRALITHPLAWRPSSD